MEEFYIDSDGIRLHAKLDKAEGVDKGPLTTPGAFHFARLS